MTDETCQSLQCFHIKAEYLAHLARGRPATISDDIRGHRGAKLAISLIDGLNRAFALIAAGKIEIDVGPLAALFGKESLEEQLHFHRIDGSDAERVTDRAVGCRAAALNQDVVFTAELDDVPNDEEIAFQSQLLDERKLALDLAPGFFVIGAKALPCAFFSPFAKE